VLVDAAPADSTAALLRAVTRALGRDVPGPQRAGDGADAGALLERLRVAAGDAWDTSEASAAGDASDVSDTRPGAPRLVLVDGLSAPVAHAVFGQLRDELWSLPYTWVVACADTDEAAFLRPPADAFFDTVVRLPPLPADAVRDLLRRRITEAELPADAVTTAVELADGNPRRALDAARRLALEPEGAPDLRRERAGRARALGALGRPAAMLMAELEASGGASASDPALLARLGWTRARAAQVLGLLADAGLVQPVDVRNGPGRPRRVYRPTAG
jgi:hypothetical protein